MKERKLDPEIESRAITRFVGKYRFLSNFCLSPVVLTRITYPTVEHAYQAAKTVDLEVRELIQGARTPGDAKRLGRTVTLRKDWDEIKIEVMRQLLRQKFADPELRAKLLATGGALLVEHVGRYFLGAR